MRGWVLFLLSVCVLFGGGCQTRKPDVGYIVLDGFALGTTYHISANMADTAGLQRSLDALFGEVTSSMSVYDHNSLLNRLNRNQTDSVDRHIAYCIEVARRASEASGGRYDITIKPVSEAWGFAGSDRQEDPNIDSLMEFVGYSKIRVEGGRLIKDDPRTEIDLNSIAKGYAVDLVGEMLAAGGAADYLVEIGGEVVCRGKNPSGKQWHIGIDQPVDGNNLPGVSRQAVLAITDVGMATSGNYRKYYIDSQGNKVVHTINALTGRSQSGNLLSATVIARDCITADAFSTMMMTMGLEASKEFLARHGELLAYLVYADEHGAFEAYVSPALEDKIRK